MRNETFGFSTNAGWGELANAALKLKDDRIFLKRVFFYLLLGGAYLLLLLFSGQVVVL